MRAILPHRIRTWLEFVLKRSDASGPEGDAEVDSDHGGGDGDYAEFLWFGYQVSSTAHV